MKILIVSWYMPPYVTMGALRVGKFCKYLDQAGHEIRVVSCANLPFVRNLPVEIPEEKILRTGSFDVNWLPKAVQKVRVALRGNRNKGPSTVGAAAAPKPEAPPSKDGPTGVAKILRALRVGYENLISYPDKQIGWLPYGVRGGRAILKTWQPDVIFASAPPFTTLLIGRSLSKRSGLPLVVEYRDRFLEDPYWTPTGLRRRLIKALEDWWIRDVKAIVTVSDPWADDYRTRFGLPVATVYNGFDPDDFPAEYPRKDATDPGVLRIVYTGILYAERRDPSPLFEAISLMGEAGRNIRVEFYGPNVQTVTAMASRYGVLDCVSVSGSVPYKESIDLQMNADVLLLLQWNDPKELGNVPGKLFEYIGARRPVLGIGPEAGVPARTLRERNAGVVVNDPKIMAEHLRTWLEEKRTNGGIPLLPASVRDGLSRPEQFAVAERFLQDAAESRI